MLKRILIFILIYSSPVLSQDLDFKILRSLNMKEMPVWDKGMKGLSNTVNPFIPVVIVGVWSHGYVTKDEVMLRNGLKTGLTIGFAAALSASIKGLVNRSRPYNKYPGEIIQRDHSGRYSFPSGHTTSAFAMATALTLSYQKWYVALPAYTYAGFVGYSRMRLGVHFPTDVLGGMVIGIGSGLLVWQLDRMFNNK